MNWFSWGKNPQEIFSDILPVVLLEDGLRTHEAVPEQFMLSDFHGRLRWTEQANVEDIVCVWGGNDKGAGDKALPSIFYHFSITPWNFHSIRGSIH